MKTEQEQIEEIVKILLESSKKCLDTDCNNCDYQYEKDCNQYRKALALVKSGYGDVKQAKIGVLNELKARHDYAIKNMGYPWDISQQIDELIKEVQNGEDKN